MLQLDPVGGDDIANQADEGSLTDHDPGKCCPIKTDSQRNYLLNLGPCQPRLAQYPVNNEIPEAKQRRFSSLWFSQYPHLEYSVSNDAAFCFVCYSFPVGPKRDAAKNAWLHNGLRLWHKMKSRGVKKPGKLEQYFSSETHKAALDDFSHFICHSSHVDVLLSREAKLKVLAEKEQSLFHQEVITIIIDAVRTLGRQGLAFRGDGNEENSNLTQILLLISRHNPVLKRWFNKRQERQYKVTYCSKRIQNEMIGLLGEEVKRIIVEEIQDADVFAVMTDSTPDKSHRDQFSVVARYINSVGEICERVFDFFQLEYKNGEEIAKALVENLNKNGLDVDKVGFQSYDFASTMSGVHAGAQKKLSELLNRTVPFIACQDHRVNTFLEHCLEVSVIIAAFFSDLQQLYVFFSSSTKRYTALDKKLQDIENVLHLRNLRDEQLKLKL